MATDIDLILDVGANIGQSALEYRHLGYKKLIYSFEPIFESYRILESRAIEDNNWETYNLALGSENGSKSINVSENTFSSSFYEILNEHTSSEPKSAYISTEKVKVTTLDHFIKSNNIISKNIYLKIDVQGFEKEVLSGLRLFTSAIKILQIELSTTPLYQNAPLYLEMMNLIESRGFKLYNILPVFSNYEKGKLLQFDGIFVNNHFIG
jgi:FkbM family methyltransferase